MSARAMLPKTASNTTMITIGEGVVAWALAARANIQKRAAG
jgi:hypothetical protein